MAIKNLVIVESPAKAKTIEKYLGSDYIVKASIGHIRDLSDKGSGTVKGVDIVEEGTTLSFVPQYDIDEDKKKVVAELKKLAKQADAVWLATDEDREGESISWHLVQALELDIHKTERITFNEITKTAIQRAIKQPRSIDQNLVNAYQARRILDRIVGFTLSPVLWRKVNRSARSAGRVQSVAVRLIVEREREIQAFVSVPEFKTTADFTVQTSPDKAFKAQLNVSFKTEKEAHTLLEKCAASVFTVSDVVVRPATKSPSAPFTTSTLQQEASRKLGMGVSRTMQIAQRLYENGYITYMRTDSVNLSEDALNSARETITRQYGAEYVHIRKYENKTANAQEAHEAIRPTDMGRTSVPDAEWARLYELIWQRTIASQMPQAQLENTKATITMSNTHEHFVAEGEVIKFDGFLKVYMESSDDDDSSDTNDAKMLPPLQNGDVLQLLTSVSIQRFSRPSKARFTEASLVKELEKRGIGRPSTYANTIKTVIDRGYVEKPDRDGTPREYVQLLLAQGRIQRTVKTENTGAEKGKLFPTDMGTIVTDFLMKSFDGKGSNIMDYNFTKQMEDELDAVSTGQTNWQEMLGGFYQPFDATINTILDEGERAETSRLIGAEPETGRNVYALVGRFGPCVRIGDQGDDEVKFASLRPGQSMATLTIAEAMELFRLPRVAGQFEGKDMKVAIGKFGPYILHDNKFVSLAKTDDPYTVEAERCMELILAKRQKDADAVLKTFDENPDIRIIKGRWGAVIAVGKEYVKIPREKSHVPTELTYEECHALAESAGALTVKTPAKKASKKKSTADNAGESDSTKVVAKKATAKKTTAKKTTAKKTATKNTVAKKATLQK